MSVSQSVRSDYYVDRKTSTGWETIGESSRTLTPAVQRAQAEASRNHVPTRVTRNGRALASFDANGNRI